MSKIKKGTKAGKLWGAQRKNEFVNSFYITQLTNEMFRIGTIQSKHDRYPEDDNFVICYRVDFPKNFKLKDMLAEFKRDFKLTSVNGNNYNYKFVAIKDAANFVENHSKLAWNELGQTPQTSAFIYGNYKKSKPEEKKKVEVKMEEEYVTIPKTLWKMYMAELDALRLFAKTTSDLIYRNKK